MLQEAEQPRRHRVQGHHVRWVQFKLPGHHRGGGGQQSRHLINVDGISYYMMIKKINRMENMLILDIF